MGDIGELGRWGGDIRVDIGDTGDSRAADERDKGERGHWLCMGERG